ncbi:sensor domain-containing protein [Arthrobacter sp. Sa2CUA1]|uniref:histidine kinase n=1 Tax=Arthrobacter gallicola TaxID=2762225 RepID=A0ABR8UV58_9MICC|nr:sensor histidine kinase [Arthrobacter gallicola]MBD7996408.1 sensor domain-containing protein [Arthrobacter gallicola]
MRAPSRTSLAARARDAAFLLREGGYWAASLGVLVAGLALLPFLPLGVGLYAVPKLLESVNLLAAKAQARSATFASAVIPFDRRRLAGRYSFTELAALLSAPETKRDLSWLLFHTAFALLAGAVALVLPLGAVLYVVASPLWPLFPPETPLEMTIAITSWSDAAFTMVLGVAYGVLAWFLLPWLARRISEGTLGILSPRRYAELSRRIQDLSAARANALAAHAAELRRIERELHDGAQNRLVGVVMMLGLAQRAAETDPAAAVPFIGRAQDAASEALAGLRAAVHDIYPPVLDELGLGGAASALTSRSPVPCSLDVEGLQRAPAAVESAAYFVLAEALTNAAKHSSASRIEVVLRTESTPREDVLVIEVADDGRGGAEVPSRASVTAGSATAAGTDAGAGTVTAAVDVGTGTGLAGIARRAAAFGGRLILVSPAGGPTKLRVELPCAF